jgi:hypothetical protein
VHPESAFSHKLQPAATKKKVKEEASSQIGSQDASTFETMQLTIHSDNLSRADLTYRPHRTAERLEKRCIECKGSWLTSGFLSLMPARLDDTSCALLPVFRHSRQEQPEQ